MVVQFFVYAQNESEARKEIEKGLEEANELIIRWEAREVGPYWKIEGMYNAIYDIVVHKNSVQQFLNIFAEGWRIDGCFDENCCASRMGRETKYIRDKFNLIYVYNYKEQDRENIVHE